MSNVNKPSAGKASGSGSGNEKSNPAAAVDQDHYNNTQDYRKRVTAADLTSAQKDWQGWSASLSLKESNRIWKWPRDQLARSLIHPKM